MSVSAEATGAGANLKKRSVADFFVGPWSIAAYTWREGIRKKTLVGFLILSLLVIFGSSFLSSFLDPTSESDIDLKLIKDICVTTISIFGVLITIFISASVVPNEVENKTVYTVLSKPVSRFQYLFGKFLGVQFIIIVNLAMMGGLFFIALYLRQRILPTLLLWSVLLTYFEFLIVSAFTFALSCTATSSVLPTIGGLFIWLTGNLIEYLKDVTHRSEWVWRLGDPLGDFFNEFTVMISSFDLDRITGFVAYFLYNIIPNLQRFSMKMQILNSQPNDPPVDMQIPWLLLYGFLYAVTGFVLAYWIFRRKEM